MLATGWDAVFTVMARVWVELLDFFSFLFLLLLLQFAVEQ